MFLDALASKGEVVRLVRLVPPEMVEEWRLRSARLNQIESDYWGCEVEVSLCPRRSRTETFYSHYVAGLVDGSQQPGFFPFGGAAITCELQRQLRRNDGVVFVHRLPAMNALMQTGLHPPRMFFDLDDVEHLVRMRQAYKPPFWPGKLAYGLHIPALFLAERRGAKSALSTFVCSAQDRDHLQRFGFPRVLVVPNAVHAPSIPPPTCAAPTILCLGGMLYQPNREAAVRLWSDIMPLIWKSVPDARLLIAGEGSQAIRVGSGDDARVERLGYVEDLNGLYERTRIICTPIINGGGTRIKLVEAASFAKPIVSTRIGAEGLSFVPDEEIVLRDSDMDIASACISLLRDDARCESLGRKARIRMLGLYQRSNVLDMVRGILY